MNEITDRKHFGNCFHDGEVFIFSQSEHQIKIFIESSPLFFEGEEIDERDRNFFLTSENTLKGLLLVKKYKKITSNNLEIKNIPNDFDYCEVLDLVLENDSIELNVNKLNYVKNDVLINYNGILITGCEYEWINFSHLKENEYPGSGDDFFDNIRDLMNKSQC